MPSIIVGGAQWGDEGKGKTVDIYAQEADVVVRTQGGNNAGHTISVNNVEYKFHIVPSGILYDNVQCIIGSGVYVNPACIINEISTLHQKNVSTSNLKLDLRAHLIMPYHILEDELGEAAKGNKSIGTTKRGIGPCAKDKYDRTGLRICDLLEPEHFYEKLKANVKYKNKLFKCMYNYTEMLDADVIMQEYMTYAEILRPYITDTTLLIYDAIKANKNVLFEGAQATFLDIDFGTYPYVTSSHVVAGGAALGAGVGPTMIDKSVGVIKAYTTRVGNGPFPTELFDQLGDYIRDNGNEYGATTGRPRRCGWFDAVMTKFAVRTSDIAELVMNKLDILSGISELKVCSSYQKGNERVDNFPASLNQLSLCKPIYETIEGWESLKGVNAYNQLPENAKKYIKLVEELCGAEITTVGVGPNRDDNIVVKKKSVF